MQKIEFYQALVKKFNKLKAEWTEMSDKLNDLSGDEYEALNLKQIETWNEMARVKNKADAINTRAK